MEKRTPSNARDRTSSSKTRGNYLGACKTLKKKDLKKKEIRLLKLVSRAQRDPVHKWRRFLNFYFLFEFLHIFQISYNSYILLSHCGT